MALEKHQLEEKLQEIGAQIRRYSMMNLPALGVLGVGLFTKNADPASLPSFLQNETMINLAMLGAGLWVVSCIVQIYQLAKEGNKLSEDIKRMEEREQ